MRLTPIFISVLFAMTLSACGQAVGSSASGYGTDENVPAGMTEPELNAPVGPQPDENDGIASEINPDISQAYFFPKYSSSFGVSKKVFDEAQRYYDQNWKNFTNTRYVVLIDMGMNASKKRLALLDLKTGTAELHLVSAGRGSDPDGDGNATLFSNMPESKKTSLGFYKTLSTYNGKHGRSLRLQGLSSTNSNAYSRAIVVHGASYVTEASNWAGRSEGCPAMDNKVVQAVIDRIQGGAMMLIDRMN
jgi:hypothetical protein